MPPNLKKEKKGYQNIAQKPCVHTVNKQINKHLNRVTEIPLFRYLSFRTSHLHPPTKIPVPND